MTVANAMQKARRGVRPGLIQILQIAVYRMSHVSLQRNSGLFDRPVMAELMVDDVHTYYDDSYVLLHGLRFK